MNTRTMSSRTYRPLLTGVLQCSLLAAFAASAHAQETGPFERGLADVEGNWQFFEVTIEEGTAAFNVQLSGGSGDADLFVRFGEQPTEFAADCAPYLFGNEEVCALPTPQAGTWFIGVHAYTDYADTTLKAAWFAAPPEETPRDPGEQPSDPVDVLPPVVEMPPMAPPPPAADWKTQILERHNFYRAQHCAPALVWDDEIAASAQSWSDGCVFTHDGVAGTGFGENLAGGIVGENAGAAVDMWYNEVFQYDFANQGFSFQTGHFTQVVWKNTTRVGCGVSQCPGSIFGWPPEQGNALMYSCRYAAPGNFSGQYEQNVSPKPDDGVCR